TLRYDQAGDSVYSTPGLRHTSTTARLPVTYIANLGYALGKTTLGVTVLNSGRGTTIQVGGEQRFGMLAARGGVVRDQRKRMQLAWGGGVRLRSEEHTSELQSRSDLVCRLLLEKKKKT